MKKSWSILAAQIIGLVHLFLYLLATSFALIGTTTDRIADSTAVQLQISKEELVRTALTSIAIFTPLILLSYALIYIAIRKKSRSWLNGSMIFFVIFWTCFFVSDWMQSGVPNAGGVVLPVVVFILLLLPKSRAYFVQK